ncbi:kinesin-domain-containing protein [Neoconidiobolus thromboides FSU 785]|nr:kinesin-domain-containing protein [Neoconidiobolus thromboides FSU 785]
MLNNELQNVSSQLKAKIEENTNLTNTISNQATSYITLESDNRVLKNQLEASQKEASDKGETIGKLNKDIEGLKGAIEELEAKLRSEETVRRQLHNTIQELKGNIRVFCRVRPPVGTECNQSTEQSHLNFTDINGDKKCIELKQVKESSLSKATTKVYPFKFDKVYGPSTKQATVFEDISQLIQSALDGYPVCIFAYGQTGSGKTFTMEGPENADIETEGMIPRAVQQIFDSADELKEKGWKYKMECQFVEIYNETLHDLLGSNSNDNKRHDIKHESNGRTVVTDITIVNVSNPKTVHNLLNKASKNRAVASTNCNERSSRSHSVFTMRLTGHNTLTQEKSEGVLNLIDLAGSESLNKSGSTGDRLKETQAINKSLSSLSDVIYSLSQQNSHIPYRNSKLTYLLQNSLGGNSKTLMFVNISPLKSNFMESLYSLQFATKVNSCQIGTAKKVVR